MKQNISKVLASIALERGVICNNIFRDFDQRSRSFTSSEVVFCVTVQERKILALQLILVVIVISDTLL